MTTLQLPPLQATPSQVPSASGRRIDPSIVVLFAITLVIGFIGRAMYLAHPFLVDSGVFICTGRVVANAQRLYHDFYDTKFPGVGLFMSLLWNFFGNHWWPYVVTQFVATILAAGMMARTAGRCIGEHAKIPAAMAGLVLLNFSPVVFGGFQLETMQAFFSLIAACACIEVICRNDWRDSFLAGLATGVACMLKPTAGAVLVAFAIVMLMHSRKIGWTAVVRHAGAVFAGLSVATAGTLAWMIRSGAMADMPALLHQLSLYGKESPFDLFEWTKPLIVTIFAGFPFLVRMWIFRRDGAQQTARAPRPLLVFALAWYVIELIGVVMQGRMYAYHFMVLAPPAALAYAMIARPARLLPIVAGFAPLMIWSLIYSAPDAARAVGGVKSPISDYLIAHTVVGDTIWADQVSRYVIETGREQGSRYPHAFFWVNFDDAPQEYWAQMLADFELHRPKYIVLEARLERWVDGAARGVSGLELRPKRAQNFRRAWRDLQTYVQQHYELETTISRQAIWRRR